MKNPTLLLLFLFSTIATAQNVKLNLVSSLDYKKWEYIYVEDPGWGEYQETIRTGLTIALQTEFGIGKRLAILSGFNYSTREFTIPYYLIGNFETNNPNNIEYCYCIDHPITPYRLLTIPIGIKLYPISFRGIHPYVALSLDLSIQSADYYNRYNEFDLKEFLLNHFENQLHLVDQDLYRLLY